ncbi:tetratricopeptide repeat protein [Asanoa sp. NPDC050611]|uniref:tetratricopeptide repeat protein n=1 Tax=Asanoa sp. NPDC050611 TaxID=3157098 RepID=UPI0033F9B384
MVGDDGASTPTIADLRKRYDEELFYEERRSAAECAYALAVRLREFGQTDEARKYARACLDLAERLPSAGLDDVVSGRQSVGGVPLPDHFHDGVVRSRLADLLAS